jgi:uncharacterized membrane protein YozB (DUF420 family)
MMSALFIALSTLVLVILALGLWKRHEKNWHIPLMSLAFLMDLALVFWIELSRQAVEKVLGQVPTAYTQESSFVLFHAGVSLLTLLLYVGLIFTGKKLLHAPEPRHRLLAAGFVLCRLTNYVTSFWMVDLLK